MDRIADPEGAARGRRVLELHIEQGPVLESLGVPLGVVLGTFGVQRHRSPSVASSCTCGFDPDGPAPSTHSLPAAAGAGDRVPRRPAASRVEALVRPPVLVDVSPGIVTAFNGTCEISLDQRALDGAMLHEMLAAARQASERLSADEGCTVECGEPLLEIEPVPFDPQLIERADAVVERLTGASPRLPSGALHDATEMARVLPTVMLFVRSIGGVSHTAAENTEDADLELAVRALDDLARDTIARLAVA